MRADVLPKDISHWDSLAESDQKKLKDMGNFFCKVHPLVTFAEEANKALLKFESACLTGKSKCALPVAGESGSVQLIRTACSAFHKRGHQAAGMEQYFVAYLNDLGIKLQLIAFEGNRFNIVFYNASAAFYHRTHIVNFIEHSAPSQNRLLSAVAEDYRNKVYLAGVRALGIIGKLITEPYFRIVGDTGCILDLNPHLHQLQISLQCFAQDASPLLDGEPVFDINLVPIDQSVVFENLLESDDQEFQVLTQQALELVCSAMLLCLERQCEDQLPGRKYWSPSPDLSAQAKSVPTSNITSERDFAVFDVLLKTRPSATTVALEALIMWMNNKTSSWVDTQSEADKAKYFEEARKNVPLIQEKMRNRRKQILETRKHKMIQKQQKKENDLRKKSQQKLELTLKIEKMGGLWKNMRQMKSQLKDLDEKQKIEYLYTQLQFHCHVLSSSAPFPFYFRKSRTVNRKKIEFDSADMEKHLKHVITENMEKVNPSLSTDELLLASECAGKSTEIPFQIRPELERDREIKQQKELLHNIFQEARIKRKSKASKSKLQAMLENPESLVGKRIKHLVQEQKESDPEWYDATVLKIDKPNQDNPLRTEYEIIYDLDGKILNSVTLYLWI